MSIDTRSPELAYASKSNIVHPGSAAQNTAAEEAAARRAADKVTPFDPTSLSASAAVLTETYAING